MPTTTLETSHDVRCKLNAEAVDSTLGVVRGCTVMKSDVQAAGKFVMLDAKGVITRDEEQCAKRIPVFTDAKTLDTLMTAAKVAGKRVKMREDHDDSVGARAGYVADFKRVTDDNGDRVAVDLHVFRSYRNRELMLETAKETPEEIGLSIDFRPTFEIVGDKALMRVAELYAVDVVDAGAVTPDGLFLSARVDNRGKSENENNRVTQPSEKMASPTPEEIMAAVGALAKTVGECSAAIAKMAAPAVAAADPEAMKAINELKTQLAAQTTTITQMKREKALLGFRGSESERIALSAAPVEDIEKLNAGKKDYLTLVAERVEKEKCKKSDAHLFVMKNHSAEYREHLNSRGIRPAAATKAA